LQGQVTFCQAEGSLENILPQKKLNHSQVRGVKLKEFLWPKSAPHTPSLPPRWKTEIREIIIVPWQPSSRFRLSPGRAEVSKAHSTGNRLCSWKDKHPKVLRKMPLWEIKKEKEKKIFPTV
jgi:hypothetical protein